MRRKLLPHAHTRNDQVGGELEEGGEGLAGFVDYVATLSHLPTLLSVVC